MIDDIFCKIIKGELPSDKVYEDEEFLVIKDIKPAAPLHLLILPKKHYFGIADCAKEDSGLLGRMIAVADYMATKHDLDKGYRIVINEGQHGGKLVPHLHAHLLGGKALGTKIIK